MTMGWFWVVLVLAAAGILTDATMRAPGTTDKRPESVALIGDSLAVGLTPPMRAAWSPVPFRSSAVGSTTFASWLFGAQQSELTATLNTHPTILLVSLGTNDLAGHVRADVLAKRAAELKARAQAAGVDVVWLLPGDLPWPTAELERALRSTGSRVILQPSGLKKPDHIHPDGQSYGAWARAVRSEFP